MHERLRPLRSVRGRQVVAYKLRVLPEVENPVDDDYVVLDEIVDSKGKSLKEETMVPELFGVYPGVEQQRIDVRE